MSLRGAVIRLKPGALALSWHASTWRVAQGERMAYVVQAIEHALQNGKRIGTRNARRRCPQRGVMPGRVLAQVERLS